MLLCRRSICQKTSRISLLSASSASSSSSSLPPLSSALEEGVMTSRIMGLTDAQLRHVDWNANMLNRIKESLHSDTYSSSSVRFSYQPHPKTGTVRDAAILIPLCHYENEPAVLFTLRSSNLSNHSGEVSFPGGMKDETDPSLQAAVLREVEEEIHFKESDVQLLGSLHPVPDKTRTIRVTPFIGYIGEFSARSLSQLTFNTDEVEEVFVLTLDELTDHSLVTWSQLGRAGLIPVFHGARKNTHTVWGLTAYVLYTFLKDVLFPNSSHSPTKSQL
eukprot:TRINITY_DN17472_c0_g1_i1.p1 TRINITY_DN17472_c0_g1~~TRINITY_DN17472_c0_g1_i1.p1  ORF type:complete len:275 (-),score=54.05 TRINITY_DN17472_c0_g1_i1:54-878(-)